MDAKHWEWTHEIKDFQAERCEGCISTRACEEASGAANNLQHTKQNRTSCPADVKTCSGRISTVCKCCVVAYVDGDLGVTDRESMLDFTSDRHDNGAHRNIQIAMAIMIAKRGSRKRTKDFEA